MARAIELLRQGRNEELWQMCCGYLSFDIEQFMKVQERLLLEQLELLNRSPLGIKITRGTRPETVEEFRRLVPLTTYADYCPELMERQENTLPVKPSSWVHTSGRSGEYPCKWVPMTPAFSQELSAILYGLGIISSCKGWGDVSGMRLDPRIIYTVAPRPYISGAFAAMLLEQTPMHMLPPMEIAENMPFDKRVSLGFEQALSEGLDFFFGISLVLASVGDKIGNSASKVNILPLFSKPRTLLRLSKGIIRSRLENRKLMPKDLWSVKGIISSGLDSGVYKDKIKESWGRYPLDMYASTESTVIATQTWDYGDMTFIPSLNFLEFIPEKEYFKWKMDKSYSPRTLLLNEVKPGETYEIVITNFHGGSLVRYRIGDMIKITSMKNNNVGINIPQMVFERRADDLLDFAVARLSEKDIWRAIENAAIPNEGWIAYKEPGELVLNILIELSNGYQTSEPETARMVYYHLAKGENDSYSTSQRHEDLSNMIKYDVRVTYLPKGAFSNYTAQRLAEGADPAHLKPPHINPSEKVLSLLGVSPVTKEVRDIREPVTIE
jgi:hypothetical protein